MTFTMEELQTSSEVEEGDRRDSRLTEHAQLGNQWVKMSSGSSSGEN